jgi:hypothetical protein
MAKSFTFPIYFLPFFCVYLKNNERQRKEYRFISTSPHDDDVILFQPPNRSIDSDYLQQYIIVYYKTAAYYYCSFGLSEVFRSLHPLTLIMGPKVIYITRYSTDLARLFIFGTNNNILCKCVSSFAREMSCIVQQQQLKTHSQVA